MVGQAFKVMLSPDYEVLGIVGDGAQVVAQEVAPQF